MSPVNPLSQDFRNPVYRSHSRLLLLPAFVSENQLTLDSQVPA